MVSSTADGHFVVTYPGDYIRANALATSSGFEVKLPFFSRNTTAAQNGYTPFVVVHILDRSGVEFANGGGFAPWPLDRHLDQSPLLIAISCKDAGMDPDILMRCNGM